MTCRRYHICLLLGAATLLAQRPPAVPLVTNDPYFSIWSMADQLIADSPRHWTGTPQSLKSLIRIDWGYLYVATPPYDDVRQAANDRTRTREDFENGGAVIAEDAFAEHNPRVRYNLVRNPVLAVSFDLGSVGAQPVSRYVMLAYDDMYSLEYFNRRVRPYWRRNGKEASDLLHMATIGYDQLMQKCAQFDEDLMADLTRTGGKEYAQMCALAYRQSIAAHKLAVDVDGTLLFFSKENFSNGSINTVDVFYPSSPFFLLMNTNLLRAAVKPTLQYAPMSRWL